MPSDDDRKKCSKFVEFYANLAYAEDSQVCGSDSKTKSGVTDGINIANCSTTSKANRQALIKKDEVSMQELSNVVKDIYNKEEVSINK